MTRRNSTDRTGRSKKEARHVRLYHWMMQTAAWKSLTGNQRAIYVEIAARYDGSNNGRIPYSVREAAEAVHISKATAARNLIVLQERGFIAAMMKGAFNVKHRVATEWLLTEFNCDVTGALPWKEFARWSPEMQNTVSPQTATVPAVRPNGICNETVTAENSSDGIRGETVKPDFAVSRSHHRYTYSLPGAGASSVSASPAAPDLTPDLSIPDFLRREN
jgi:hypothetical protein